MTYFLSYKSYKGKDHERTCNPHFIFKLQNSFGGICHSNVHVEAKLEGEELSPFVIGSVGLVGFAIPWAVFRIPKPRIPDSTSKIVPDSTSPMQKIYRIPESKFPYLGRNTTKVELKEVSPLFSGEPFPSWLFQV